MGKQKQDPTIEWGFHAVIPRVVRTGYEKLTPVQKWLYVCLKDLCGEHGTCYRALRVLATETGISTGMLSESIRALHDAGLIHAEKKRRSNNPTAKEVWHITIVDIWQANAKEHPTKRSQNEHSNEDNVHTVNNNVQQVNNISTERSQNEQKRSHSETEEVSITSINIEEVSLSSNVVATSAEDRNAPTPIDLIEEKKKRTDPRIPAIPKGNVDDRTHSSDTSSNDHHNGRGDPDSPHHESETARQAESTASEQTVTVPPVSGFPSLAQAAIAPVATTPPGSTQRGAGLALTARQIKAQNEKREKELWGIIEQERNTKYTSRQRELYQNKEGMKCLIADDTSDEALREGLKMLDDFQRKSFTVLKFYEWMPNLQAKAPTPIAQAKPTQNNYVNHELNMRKLEERKARLTANG